MPPQRRRAPKNKAASAASRVHKINSREQWDAMMKKAGSTRLVVVQFYQTHVWTCKQMRPYFVRSSTHPKFRKAVFAEVDVDEQEDLARLTGIKRIPTYQCYWEGAVVDSYEGGNVDQMNELISRNLKEYDSSGGPLATALKIIAAAALLAGGTLVAKHFAPEKASNDVVDPSTQILELKKRIMAAQGRLRNMERANRGKQARAQRKLIEQLNVQVRTLEKASGKASSSSGTGPAAPEAAGSRKERQKSGASTSGAASGAEASEGGGSGIGGRRGGSPKKGGHGLDFDDLARLRRRKLRGDVLYSDEEDILVSLDA